MCRIWLRAERSLFDTPLPRPPRPDPGMAPLAPLSGGMRRPSTPALAETPHPHLLTPSSMPLATRTPQPTQRDSPRHARRSARYLRGNRRAAPRSASCRHQPRARHHERTRHDRRHHRPAPPRPHRPARRPEARRRRDRRQRRRLPRSPPARSPTCSASSAPLLRIAGAGLLAFAAVVWLVATAKRMSRARARDDHRAQRRLGVGCVAAALADLGTPTTVGAVWMIAQALVVAGFAELQLTGPAAGGALTRPLPCSP